ncbi:MAG: Gfo/Idh/MocA family oxidoreductase [Eubacteriales bacterium]|nr:Gfo/Idh/MocA family oxidoreductase [Eubacteriales bacterium]
MKDLRIGLIGCGAIGEKHALRIQNNLQNCHLAAVSDAKQENAARVASVCNTPVIESSAALIASPDIDAIVVTAWDPAHKDLVLDCIAHGKYVFCEKPLATTASACREIINAEVSHGKRLVQVGFMRRFDRGYRLLKQSIEQGVIGNPLMVHCAHRSPSIAPGFSDDYMISQVCIHEIDLIQWLVGDTYESVYLEVPRQSCHAEPALHDPQIAHIRTKTGICIDVELFVNCRFGYDIQCQIVGENGAIRLPDPTYYTIRQNGFRGMPLCTNWEERFADAYHVEMQAWVDSTLAGTTTGSNSWDGYVAAVTADALNESRRTEHRISIDLPPKPSLYP